MAEGSDTKNNKIPPAEDTPQERPPFATAAMFLGAGAALIGLLGIIGMFLGISVFTSFFLGYKTIALSASVIWIIFGCVLTYHAATPLRGRMRTFVAAVVALVSIFAALEFFFAIRGEHFIVETWSVQLAEAISATPSSPISPVALGLVILTAIALFFLLYASGPSDERRRAQDSAGILGLAIFIMSVTFALSYVYPVPLLYHTQIIPIAFTSAIAAILMGAGLISAAGPRALPLTYITGPSTRARLLRAFLPLTVIIILVQSFLMVSVTADFIIHDVILLAVSVVIFSLVTLVVVAKVSGGVSADIDRLQQEFKKADAEMRESEEKFRDIFNNANDAIEIVELLDNGLPGRYLDLNDVACRMVLYTREEMLRLGPLGINTDYFNWPFDEIMRELHTTGHAIFETEHRRKDGVIVPVEVNSHKISLLGKTVLISITRDITERKNAEALLKQFNEELEQQVKARTEELNTALGEKEILLREIHHRVRNTIQLAVSMMKMQIRRENDNRIREALLSTQNRLNAIASTFDMLYYSENMSRVNFGRIIRSIVGSIQSAYKTGEHPLHSDIHIDIQSDIPELGVDLALPLALITSELVTNAFQNAFPDGRNGKVTITGSKDEQGQIILIVSDNGSGLPEGFSPAESVTTGLTLVHNLVQQINGTLSYETSGKGTRFVITVPRDAKSDNLDNGLHREQEER